MKNVSDSRFQKRFMVVTGLGFVASTFFFSFQNFSTVDNAETQAEVHQSAPAVQTPVTQPQNVSKTN